MLSLYAFCMVFEKRLITSSICSLFSSLVESPSSVLAIISANVLEFVLDLGLGGRSREEAFLMSNKIGEWSEDNCKLRF